MNPAEDRVCAAIDRKTGKAQTSARTLAVREMARAEINCAVMSQPEEDRAEYMGAAIRHLRALYGAGEGEAEAVALFGSLAWSKALQVRGVVSKAEAERLFHARANDGEAAA